MKEFLDYTLFQYDNYQLKVSSILGLFLWILVVNLVLRLIKKGIDKTTKIDRAKKNSIYTLIRYIILVFAILYSFQIFRFNLSLFLAGSAALLVGIGLGLQNIFSDFVSGIILLVEAKIKVDDIIEVNNLVCKVQEINLRTTTVLTRDDRYIIVPNTDLTKNRFINWTLSNIASRFEVSVGVSYSSDVSLVKKILENVAESQEGVLKNPVPFVRFNEFGDSSLDFSLYFWSEEVYRVENIKSDIRIKIFQQFNENNISIPFPQRVLHYTDKPED
ncbi:MAG: mechanosensitive ion channel domain-containing protein [Ginsengibacter sp.]